MSKYDSINIKKAMNNIAQNNYLLPAIQRKFVWEFDQVEMLFDSIMRNYPINSFMLWKITDNDIKQNYKFYQFIKDFAKKFHEDNPDASSELLSNDFFAVIDGQQRLTSLYIGLIGSYRVKRPSKRWRDTEDAMPTKRLYLELSEKLPEIIDNSQMYNFKFKSDKELEDDLKANPTHFWFKVGDVLKFEELSDVHTYIMENDLANNKFATRTLSNLFNKINTEELINFYTIEEQDQDKVLDVFLRTNSGGTPLSFSDLLMSIASANWSKFDARDEMRNVREQIYKFGNPNFDVSQDFILKSILVLSNKDVRFKINNFGKNNIAIFENNWEKIKESLIATFELLDQLGFNDSLLRAKNASIPIAYYIYKNNLAKSIVKTTYDSEDKKNISKWLSMSLLKGFFGGHSDSILTTMRDVILNSNSGKFPINEIIDVFKGETDRNYNFDEDIINAFIEEEYGSPVCSLCLMLLYADVVLEHGTAIAVDHMHPKTIFENSEKLAELGLDSEKIKFYKENYNRILNLQLLDEIKNKSKGDIPLDKWAKENYKTEVDLFIDKGVSLDIKDFEAFIKNRKKNIVKKLKKILEIKN